jgi:hypothetical protein
LISRVKDRTRKRFGRLVVLEQAGFDHSYHARWLCQCDCGKTIVVSSSNLGRSTQSCGCYRDEHYGQGRQKKHGLWKSDRWWMYQSARSRAKKKSISFSIKVTDIPEIPSHCPILGFPLVRSVGVGSQSFNSPTLDRIKPELGYVPGNLQVISQRANVIKNDASAEEIRKVADYMAKLEAA